jgi:replicative superfamily II helicase
MIDFKKKLAKVTTEKHTDPLEIYDTLDRKSITGPLRPAQLEILSSWFKNRKDDKDLIIKLHTGEGKTLIGLLILFSKLNSTQKPSAFICPNKYLVEQVCAEAKKFGIPFCTIQADKELPNDFLSSKKILITHIQKIFNGKSKFGIDSNFTRVGSLILDDSHACIDSIKNSFTIKLGSTHAAYQKILTLFEDDLRDQGEGSLLDVKKGNYDVIMPIPYWSWIDKKNEVTQILSDHQIDTEITFVWPIVKDHIDKTQAFISGKEIEITPYLMPLEKFGSFTNADQRILMSATTQDDSFFIKGLNFSIESVRNPLTLSNQKWSGEKMLLLPSLIDEILNRETIISKFAPPSNKPYGIVSLVSSTKKAQEYSELGAVITNTENIFSKIIELKNGSYKNTIVVINRYDGIDLPDEACRILIIDSMPYFNSLSEKYEEASRATSDIINIKIAQKIEQGLGRSVRGEKDYTVILLLGADLVKFVKSITSSPYFSEQTRKQIEIGLSIAEFAKEELATKDSFDILKSLIQQSINRDEGWKEFYKEEMDKIVKENTRNEIYNTLQTERDCEYANSLGDYETAVIKMQKLIDSLSDNNEKGWYLQSLARYKYRISKVESNLTQKSAFKSNLQLLAPKDGISYKKIEFINENRIKRIKNFQLSFKSFQELSLAIDSILNDLTFGVEAGKFEKALQDVGTILGFISQRPDKELKDSWKFLILLILFSFINSIFL